MANVIGIPLLKGNSQVIVAGLMRNTLPENVFAGMAVAFHSNNEGVNINFVETSDPAAGNFAGFIVETNECASTCTVIRAGEMIPLPTDGVNFAAGDPLTVDPATGKLDPAGSLSIAGTVINDGADLTFKNGKNGNVYPGGLLANLSLSPVLPTAPAATAAAKSTKLTDK